MAKCDCENFRSDYCRLINAKVDLEQCPNCGTIPFTPFLRGQVRAGTLVQLREGLKSIRKDRLPRVYASICRRCKEVIGYEDVDGNLTIRSRYCN